MYYYWEWYSNSKLYSELPEWNSSPHTMSLALVHSLLLLKDRDQVFHLLFSLGPQHLAYYWSQSRLSIRVYLIDWNWTRIEWIKQNIVVLSKGRKWKWFIYIDLWMIYSASAASILTALCMVISSWEGSSCPVHEVLLTLLVCMALLSWMSYHIMASPTFKHDCLVLFSKSSKLWFRNRSIVPISQPQITYNTQYDLERK